MLLLHWGLIALAAQPRVNMPRRAFAMADGDRDRPLPWNHVTACEDPWVRCHHVRPHRYNPICDEFNSRHLPKEATIRFLTQGQHDCVGLECFESSGRLCPS